MGPLGLIIVDDAESFVGSHVWLMWKQRPRYGSDVSLALPVFRHRAVPSEVLRRHWEGCKSTPRGRRLPRWDTVLLDDIVCHFTDYPAEVKGGVWRGEMSEECGA